MREWLWKPCCATLLCQPIKVLSLLHRSPGTCQEILWKETAESKMEGCKIRQLLANVLSYLRSWSKSLMFSKAKRVTSGFLSTFARSNCISSEREAFSSNKYESIGIWPSKRLSIRRILSSRNFSIILLLWVSSSLCRTCQTVNVINHANQSERFFFHAYSKKLTRRFNCSISASSCLIVVSAIFSLRSAPARIASSDFNWITNHKNFRHTYYMLLHEKFHLVRTWILEQAFSSSRDTLQRN